MQLTKGPRNILISSLLFFVLVNTSYFIEELNMLVDFLLVTVLGISALILGIVLVFQFFKLWKERFKDRSRVLSTLVLTLVLLCTYFFPAGIINYEDLQGEDLLVANIEGVANCQTVLKLKKNNTFIQTSACFGIEKWRGTCEFVGDTVKLHYNDTTELNYKFAFGLIKLNPQKDHIGRILMFRSYDDSIQLPMGITYYNK